MGKNSQTASFENETFRISRTFDAPRALMFELWTDVEHLTRWWGPKGFRVTHAALDLRPGGRFHYCLKSPDGTDMWGKFQFRRVEAPELLEFISSFSDKDGGTTRHPMHQSWPLELLSIVTFAEADGRTTVTVQWTPHNASALERQTFIDGAKSMEMGWTGTFDQLEAYVERAKASA